MKKKRINKKHTKPARSKLDLQQQAKPKFQLEALEPRILLSATWVGTEADDSHDAGNHGDDLYGMGGNDVLRGGTSGDLLDGGAGNDQLFGNQGKDVLISGGGNDFMDGGVGNDTFLFTGAQNGDSITVVGGHGGQDTIDLSNHAANNVNIDGSTITVNLGGGQSFTINHSQVENILTGPAVDTAPTAPPDADAPPSDEPPPGEQDTGSVEQPPVDPPADPVGDAGAGDQPSGEQPSGEQPFGEQDFGSVEQPPADLPADPVGDAGAGDQPSGAQDSGSVDELPSSPPAQPVGDADADSGLSAPTVNPDAPNPTADSNAVDQPIDVQIGSSVMESPASPPAQPQADAGSGSSLQDVAAPPSASFPPLPPVHVTDSQAQGSDSPSPVVNQSDGIPADEANQPTESPPQNGVRTSDHAATPHVGVEWHGGEPLAVLDPSSGGNDPALSDARFTVAFPEMRGDFDGQLAKDFADDFVVGSTYEFSPPQPVRLDLGFGALAGRNVNDLFVDVTNGREAKTNVVEGSHRFEDLEPGAARRRELEENGVEFAERAVSREEVELNAQTPDYTAFMGPVGSGFFAKLWAALRGAAPTDSESQRQHRS